MFRLFILIYHAILCVQRMKASVISGAHFRETTDDWARTVTVPVNVNGKTRLVERKEDVRFLDMQRESFVINLSQVDSMDPPIVDVDSEARIGRKILLRGLTIHAKFNRDGFDTDTPLVNGQAMWAIFLDRGVQNSAIAGVPSFDEFYKDRGTPTFNRCYLNRNEDNAHRFKLLRRWDVQTIAITDRTSYQIHEEIDLTDHNIVVEWPANDVDWGDIKVLNNIWFIWGSNLDNTTNDAVRWTGQVRMFFVDVGKN